MADIVLKSGVHVAIDKDAAVLLDLERDRYFSIKLEGSEDEAPGAATGDRLGAVAQRLFDAGLASEARARLSRAEIASLQHETHLLRASHAGPFFRACFWARAAVARRRMDRALADLAQAAAQRPRADADEAAVWRMQERFERLRPFFPGDRICLFDTLALARFAISQSIGLDIVFGVRVRPFSAHCWAEWRGVVLNDRYGHAQSYQTILRAAL